MKTRIIILTAFLVSFVYIAQAQDFSTGSALMSSGSQYTPTVTAVGASYVGEDVSESAQASGRAGIRKLGGVGEGGDERSEESPVGEPYILLAFAALAAGVVYLRRRQSAKN